MFYCGLTATFLNARLKTIDINKIAQKVWLQTCQSLQLKAFNKLNSDISFSYKQLYNHYWNLKFIQLKVATIPKPRGCLVLGESSGARNKTGDPKLLSC